MRDLYRIYLRLTSQRECLHALIEQRGSNDGGARAREAVATDLANIDHALAHFEAGNYGVCEHCAQHIGDLRLQLQPQATTCAACGTHTGGSGSASVDGKLQSC